MASYGGLILAMPVVLWQVWRFIVPALHAKERRYAIPFIPSSVSLFLLGGLLAYLTLGKAIEFLIGWSGCDVGALFQVSKYIRLVGLMVAAFGIGFQFPVLLVFLMLVGVLTPQQLIKQWRYALIVIFVVAAVITPSGDPISLFALAVPMTFLYFVSYFDRALLPATEAPQGSSRGLSRPPWETRRCAPNSGPRSSTATPSPSTTSSSRRSTPSTPATTSSSPRRRAAARRSSPSTASRSPGGPAAGRSTPHRSRRCRTRSSGTCGERYGAGNVGLLTGDNAIDGDAPIVVMTTEVLRNMIYAGSAAVDDLGLVVLDEVHFLQDTYRGPVWEEVIVHLPEHVQLVCLSATVSNTAELAAWIQTVRGPTTPVVELRRPVHLHDRYLVGDRTNDRLHFLETFEGGRPNPEAITPRRVRGAAAGWRGHERASRGAAVGGCCTRPGGSRRSTCSSSAGCCRRSSSSSAATSARRRRGRVWPLACG